MSERFIDRIQNANEKFAKELEMFGNVLDLLTRGQVPAIVGQLRPSDRWTVFVKTLHFVTDFYTFPFSDEPKIAIPL